MVQNETVHIARLGDLESVLPAWHKSNPSMIERAIKAAASHACRLDPINFLPRLPRLARASYNIKCTPYPTSGLLLLDKAATAPWIAIDSRDYRNAIVLDVDHGDGVDLASDLPAEIRPHIVLDPWSGRSAAIFMLSLPVNINSNYMKPRQLFSQVSARLAKHFKAKALPHGTLTKNPWGRVSELAGPLIRRTAQPTSGTLWDAWEASKSPLCWHTTIGAKAVELSFLRDHFWSLQADDAPPPPIKAKRFHDVESQLGRNCELFDTLRFWCYDNVERSPDVILKKAVELNVFLEPLDYPEVAGIAKSIANFMETYEPKEQWDRGIMNLRSSGFTLPQKQKLAALRTADIKAERTLALLRGTVKYWNPELDGKMTQAAVAAKAKVYIKTVKRAWKML